MGGPKRSGEDDGSWQRIANSVSYDKLTLYAKKYSRDIDARNSILKMDAIRECISHCGANNISNYSSYIPFCSPGLPGQS